MAKSKSRDQISKENTVSLITRGIILVFIIFSRALLGDDFFVFWIWEAITLLLTFIARPLLARLFENFYDGGWVFIRSLSIFIPSFITWILVSTGFLPFSQITCIAVTLIIAAAAIYYRIKYPNKKEVDKNLIIVEEMLLLTMFLIWTYIFGFRGEAYGVEKYMDYGFMAALNRSKTVPFTDIWYSSAPINYYYIGQFIAVYLTRICFTTIDMTYNLMRSFIAALAFAMPFSLVYQMLSSKHEIGWHGKFFRSLAGTCAGLFATVCGNAHYIVYGLIKPLIDKSKGLEVKDYWYADATRYIGFNPDTNDKCICEFPCYSFVLGDLHAHVINTMFVIVILGLLYAWTMKVRKEKPEFDIKKILLQPQLLMCAFMLGGFQGINFWDFAIYFTIFVLVVFFTNVIIYDGRFKDYILATGAQTAEAYILGAILILPFSLKFDTELLVGGVKLCENHSLPYQLAIIWGLPTVTFILFMIMAIIGINNKPKNVLEFLKSISPSDYFIGIIGVCAVGLYIVPEIVYVVDICETGGYARANTMFKLTYQAFILFGIVSGYAIFTSLKREKVKVIRVLMMICLALYLVTMGYMPKAAKTYYGDFSNTATRAGINATSYLERNPDLQKDAAGIRWLNDNVEGVHVVLELNGERYTADNRVSAMTGLPTVMGWYVHEWLWRGDTDDLNIRGSDVNEMFTSPDYNTVRALIDKYNVEYVFVGDRERLKWGDSIKHDVIKSLGETVFTDSESDTYIVKVNR